MKIMIALLGSFFIHFILVLWLAHQPIEVPLHPLPTYEVEIVENAESKDKEKNQHRQLVRQVPVPEKYLRPDDDEKALFMSEKKQRVLKQMRSLKSGMTQNFDQRMVKQNTNRNYLPDLKTQQNEIIKKNMEMAGVGNPVNKNNSSDLAMNSASTISSTGESMPTEVSIGSLTAVNTDRFLYYSFYSRIEELVRFRWETKVKTAASLFDVFYFKNVIKQQTWVTDIEFWLTSEGRLHSAHILKESGVKPFDGAAVMAFREAGIFPHPPPELKEDDGFVRVRFVFNVRMDN